MNNTRSASFRVRGAAPTDVPELMRLKRALAESENSLHAVRASAADWLRDGFGPQPKFAAFIAQLSDAPAVIGMATYSQCVVTGWDTPVLLLQDLYVEPVWRQHGVARALMTRVAARACEIGSPIIELTVRAGNPAQDFYLRNGFQPVPQCLTYVIAGPALAALAERDADNRERLALAG